MIFVSENRSSLVPANESCSFCGGSTFGRHPEGGKIGDGDGAFVVGRARRRPVIGHRLRPVDPIRHHLLSGWAYRSRAEIGAYILPDDLAISGNLKQAAVHAFVDECVSVGQPAGTADKRTVEGPLR